MVAQYTGGSSSKDTLTRNRHSQIIANNTIELLTNLSFKSVMPDSIPDSLKAKVLITIKDKNFVDVTPLNRLSEYDYSKENLKQYCDSMMGAGVTFNSEKADTPEIVHLKDDLLSMITQFCILRYNDHVRSDQYMLENPGHSTKQTSAVNKDQEDRDNLYADSVMRQLEVHDLVGSFKELLESFAAHLVLDPKLAQGLLQSVFDSGKPRSGSFQTLINKLIGNQPSDNDKTAVVMFSKMLEEVSSMKASVYAEGCSEVNRELYAACDMEIPARNTAARVLSEYVMGPLALYLQLYILGSYTDDAQRIVTQFSLISRKYENKNFKDSNITRMLLAYSLGEHDTIHGGEPININVLLEQFRRLNKQFSKIPEVNSAKSTSLSALSDILNEIDSFDRIFVENMKSYQDFLALFRTLNTQFVSLTDFKEKVEAKGLLFYLDYSIPLKRTIFALWFINFQDYVDLLSDYRTN